MALGPLAIAMMQGIRVRKAILGAGGIVAEGIYNSNSLLVETERQMMTCGQEVVIVADHTKFGRLALARLCGLDEIDRWWSTPACPTTTAPSWRPRAWQIHLAPLEAESTDGAADGAAADRRPEDRTHEHRRPRRDQVEQLVRSILRQQIGDGDGGPKPANGEAYRPNLVVNISAGTAT